MEFVRPLLAAPLLGALVLASAIGAQAKQSDETGAAQQKASGPVGLPGIIEPTPTQDVTEQVAEQPQDAAPPADQPDALDPAPPLEEPGPSSPRVSLTPPPGYVLRAGEADTAPVTPPTSDPRRLAPRSLPTAPQSPGERPRLLGFSWDSLPFEPATSAAALGLVVGLFLLTAALLKRAAPKSQRLLPGEVASVVGRIPLGGKQTAHLLKIGSKLVLVHITPEGAKPLTEVTDPAEVNRLLGLCEQGGDYSATTAFQDVFEKLTSEPTEPGFLGGESPLIDRQQLAAAYANTPGGRGAR